MVWATFISAQVGIGSQTFSPSEVLKISSSNKGVLIPNVNITDLLNAAPVLSPANSLLVYNTQTSTGKGFYYWKIDRWTLLLNTTNIYKYLAVIRTETVIYTGNVTDHTPNTGTS